MKSPAGTVVAPDVFPASDILMAPSRYDYEGNWLFCTFNQPSLRAMRLGFGQGRFRWDDYGLTPPGDSIPLAYRIEAVSSTGVEACLFSAEFDSLPVKSHAGVMDLGFSQGNEELFRITGWPSSEWRFRYPDGTLWADLAVTPRSMVVWPDCLMPHTTFSMCIGACDVRGKVRTSMGEVMVDGRGFYDHPRVRIEDHDVPPFGWYIYSPLSFTGGTMLAMYHAEDGHGAVDQDYSAGFLTMPDGHGYWLKAARVRDLEFAADGNPRSWSAELSGTGVEIRLSVRIEDLPLERLWSSQPQEGGKYLAFPLLMVAEGESVIGGTAFRLAGGSGIAEFLRRKT